MIILRERLFHSKKNRSANVKTASPIKDDFWFVHHTTPKSMVDIMKSGGINAQANTKGVSTYPAGVDPLITEDLNKLMGNIYNDYNKPIEASEDDIKYLTKRYKSRGITVPPSDKISEIDFKIADTTKSDKGYNAVTKAGKYRANGGDTSQLFVSSHGGTIADPKNPKDILQSIDGLHEGNGVESGLSYKKTRNPVSFLINGKDTSFSPGSDALEMVLKPEDKKINLKDVKILINKGGFTHDTDARKLRKYLRAHKGEFEMTKELQEFLYGTKNSRVSNFPSQEEVLKDIPKIKIDKEKYWGGIGPVMGEGKGEPGWLPSSHEFVRRNYNSTYVPKSSVNLEEPKIVIEEPKPTNEKSFLSKNKKKLIKAGTGVLATIGVAGIGNKLYKKYYKNKDKKEN